MKKATATNQGNTRLSAADAGLDENLSAANSKIHGRGTRMHEVQSWSMLVAQYRQNCATKIINKLRYCQNRTVASDRLASIMDASSLSDSAFS